MSLFLIGISLKTLGEVVVGLAVILVHVRIMKEHKLDRRVYKSIRNEKFWGLVGVVLIISGFLLEVAYYIAGGVI